MFTGIIEAVATISEVRPEQLTIDRPAMFDDIRIGSSICVSGVCLSVIAFDDTSMTFDLVEETLQRSKLGKLRTGDRVNLERSMKLGSRLDGHMVQGHVEGVGTVASGQWKVDSGKWTGDREAINVRCPLSVLHFIVPQGSIALDGVSLTIASIDGDRVSVALIPHTIERTTLGLLRQGDCVNIETDILLRGRL